MKEYIIYRYLHKQRFSTCLVCILLPLLVTLVHDYEILFDLVSLYLLTVTNNVIFILFYFSVIYFVQKDYNPKAMSKGWGEDSPREYKFW